MEKSYEINNVTIDKIYSSTTDRDGKPYVSKKGNPFTKIDIYIDPREIDDPDFEGKMTYFDYFDNMTNYGQGAELSGKVKRVEWNDKVFFNFEFPPSGKKAIELDVKELWDAVKELQEEVFGKQRTAKEKEVKQAIGFSKEALKEEPEVEEDDEGLDDLPF
jgi:hypothetical protein